ncbi:hypothetical protein PSPO01_03711 [Paraphaeosphaeria sporulosa]
MTEAFVEGASMSRFETPLPWNPRSRLQSRDANQAREASIRPTSATSLEGATASRLKATKWDTSVANAPSEMNVIVCRSEASQDVEGPADDAAGVAGVPCTCRGVVVWVNGVWARALSIITTTSSNCFALPFHLSQPQIYRTDRRTNQIHTILRNGEQHQILLLAPNTTAPAATVNIRQPSSTAHAFHRLIAMSHNAVHDSKPTRLWIGQSDQSLSPTSQGCLTPIHAEGRDTDGPDRPAVWRSESARYVHQYRQQDGYISFPDFEKFCQSQNPYQQPRREHSAWIKEEANGSAIEISTSLGLKDAAVSDPPEEEKGDGQVFRAQHEASLGEKQIEEEVSIDCIQRLHMAQS